MCVFAIEVWRWIAELRNLANQVPLFQPFQTSGVISGSASVRRKSCSNITVDSSRPAHDWKTAMNQFAILYAERSTKTAASDED